MRRPFHRCRAVLAPLALLVLVGVLFAGCSSEDDESATQEGDAGATTLPTNDRGATVPSPTVTGPVEGGVYGMPFNPMPARLADEFGYVEEEYFVSGTATAYAPTADWTADGEWGVTATTTAPYRTRLLVRRPADAADFNGTVLVEWLNVTSGMDADPDFGFAHEALMAAGTAYVGVSAQLVGVEGGEVRLQIEGFEPRPLKEWDPERYADLEHPGDDYSYDIFSQAAQALRRPSGVDPLRDLDPTYLLAAGESQSAGRMVTYVNAVQPEADIYDGFLIHSRGGTGATIGAARPGPMPAGARVRTDASDPVIVVQTETDLFRLGSFAARQPDTDGLRTWEIAGTAHADQSTLDYGIESGRQWDTTTELDFTAQCGVINDGPQGPVVRRAVEALTSWVASGDPPATGAPIEVRDGAIVRDEHGNALGGIRTPPVDAPVATLSGEPDEGESVICSLFGSTTPFTSEQLAARYPTKADYVEAVRMSADSAVAAGFLRRVDADAMIADAESAPVPS